MKTLLLLFCIFSITRVANAQLFRKTWETGSYTDTSGRKFSGLIFYAIPEASVFKGKGDHLLFKADKNADQQKIASDRIAAFTISTDSFTVSHVPALEKFPFLQIIINHQTKLYYSAIAQGSIPIVGAGLIGGAIGAAALSGKGSTAYYFGSDADHITTLRGKNFVEAMSTVMSDKPEVVAKIRNKTFKPGSMKKLLAYYLTGVLPKESVDDVY